MVPGERYQAYIQNNLLGSHPLDLVTALYEGAIEATQDAARCLKTGDVWGRSKAVSKATNILTQLLVSLNHEKGGTLSRNLKRLYAYMQSRLIEAHANKSEKPLEEVERLLTTLLEAWRVVAAKERQAEQPLGELTTNIAALGEDHLPAVPYGGYFYEPVDTFSRTAVTF